MFKYIKFSGIPIALLRVFTKQNKIIQILLIYLFVN